MNRRAVTLVELTVSLGIFALVSALLMRVLIQHERAQVTARSTAESLRGARAAADILARSLADAAPQDLSGFQSSDTALEFMAPVGAGQACVIGDHVIVATSAPADGPTYASFLSLPQSGDQLLLFADGPTPAWRDYTVTDVWSASDTCGVVAAPPNPALTLTLAAAPDGAGNRAFVLARRTRFSLYRSSDGRWYLGMREWNPDRQRFDQVQPAAGPLRPASRDSNRTGLRFMFRDTLHAAMNAPFDSAALTSVEIIARGLDSTHVATRVVALHRAH